MKSRIVREGSVGLLVLVGLGLLGALILWLRGYTFGQRTYRVVVEFANAGGMQAGAAVRYRGVTIGRIFEIRPGANGVDVEIEITNSELAIPRDVIIEANQSGLISETLLDIRPLQPLSANAIAANSPLAPDCDPAVIICDGARLQGQIGVSFDDLIRLTVRFADLYSDPTFFANVNAATKNTAEAAAGVAKLTQEFSGLSTSLQQELRNVSASTIASANAVGQTANQFSLTATQLNNLIETNRGTLVSTLNNLSQTSDQLRTTVTGLSPVLNRVQQGELLRNLEILSANAAQASTNLNAISADLGAVSVTVREASTALNTPTNLLVLQQTLDSARVTFQNVQKITSDLDELTGDPNFRRNLRELVNGLSGLVSSTQQLEQQTQLAQTLAPLAATISDRPPEPTQPTQTTKATTKPSPVRKPLQSAQAPSSRPWTSTAVNPAVNPFLLELEAVPAKPAESASPAEVIVEP